MSLGSSNRLYAFGDLVDIISTMYDYILLEESSNYNHDGHDRKKYIYFTKYEHFPLTYVYVTKMFLD